jgi:hypothetical protein
MMCRFQTEQQFPLEYLKQQIVHVTTKNYLLFTDAPTCFSIYSPSWRGSFTDIAKDVHVWS